MTASCAWCGEAVPAQRRGRKGARAFCCREHMRAFEAKARDVGAALLDGAGMPAEAATALEHCRGNSCGRSRTVPPAPSEVLTPYTARLQ